MSNIWTYKQVRLLVKRQRDKKKHPYTCPRGHTLTPTTSGWTCRYDGYNQNWALAEDVLEEAG